MTWPAARLAPSVKVGASEVQLAPTTLLLGGDRTLGRELTKRVAMDPKVLSGMPGIEPIVAGRLAGQQRVRRARETLHNSSGDLVDQGVEQRPSVIGVYLQQVDPVRLPSGDWPTSPS